MVYLEKLLIYSFHVSLQECMPTSFRITIGCIGCFFSDYPAALLCCHVQDEIQTSFSGWDQVGWASELDGNVAPTYSLSVDDVPVLLSSCSSNIRKRPSNMPENAYMTIVYISKIRKSVKIQGMSERSPRIQYQTTDLPKMINRSWTQASWANRTQDQPGSGLRDWSRSMKESLQNNWVQQKNWLRDWTSPLRCLTS